MNNKTYISLDTYISKIYNHKKGTMWIIGHTFFLNIFILDVFYNEKGKSLIVTWLTKHNNNNENNSNNNKTESDIDNDE